MSRSERRTDSNDKNIERLEQRHIQLKQRVAEYEARRTLSSKEQIALQKLKKEKLATKDAIHKMTHA